MPGTEFFLSDFVAQDLDLVHKDVYFYVDGEPIYFIIRASQTRGGYYVRELSDEEVASFGFAETQEE